MLAVSNKAMQVDNNNHWVQIIRINDLIKMIRLSRSSIYSKMDPNSPQFDDSFPKAIKLGTGPKARAVGWILGDVITWLAGLTQKNPNDTI